MWIYFDTLYRTFAFAPVNASVTIRGTVVSAEGSPIPWSEVSVISDDRILQRTLTNEKGEFRLFGDLGSAQTIKAAGVTQQLLRTQAEVPTVNIRAQ